MGLEGLPTIPTLSSRHTLRDSTDGSRTVISDDDYDLGDHRSGEALTEGPKTAETTPSLPTIPLTRETAALDLCDPDASLWSRWASSSPDVDVFSTIALLAHTLPDTDEILSRWDEAPFQPRPFSILALPHVQALLAPPLPRRRPSHQLAHRDDRLANTDRDARKPSSLTPSHPLHSSLVPDPDAETCSVSSETTEYFSAQSEVGDDNDSPLESTLLSHSQSPSQYSTYEIIAVPKRRMVTPIPRFLARDIILSPGDNHRLSYLAPLDQSESELWLRAQRQLIHRPLIADAEPPQSEGGDPDTFTLDPFRSDGEVRRKRRTGRFSLRLLRNSLRSSKSTKMSAPIHDSTVAGSTEAIVSPYLAHRSTGARAKLKKARREHEGFIVSQPDDLDRVERASIASTPYKIAEWLHAVFNPASTMGTDTASERHMHSSIRSMPR